MAKLTSKKRKALPKADFAGGAGKYPIPDKSHARAALARVAANGTPAEIAKVRSAVRKKFPSIAVGGRKGK